MPKLKMSIVGQKWRDLDPYLPGIAAGTPAKLVRDSDNEHDKNAVQVWIGDQHVGFLSSRDNPPIAKAMDTAARADSVAHNDSGGVVSMLAKMVRSPNSGYPQVEIEIPD